jgi:hypothetical protein
MLRFTAPEKLVLEVAAAIGQQQDQGDWNADNPEQGRTHSNSPTARSVATMIDGW